MQEIKEILRSQDEKKKKKKKKDDVLVFQDGNESVVMPKRTVGGLLDSALPSVINIVIGAIAGGLLCFFLLFPAYRDSVVKKTSESLISANTDNLANTNNIEVLRDRVEELTDSLLKYEGKEDLSESYNHVLKALILFSEGDLDGAYKEVENVNVELLEGDAADYYKFITLSYKEKEAGEKYQDAYNAYRIKDFDKAYNGFLEVLELNEKCEDGLALYYMADICTELQKFEEGIKYCERYIELFPEGRFVRDINTQLESLRKALEDGEVPDNSDNSGTAGQTGNTGNTGTTTTQGTTGGRTTIGSSGNTGNDNETGNNGNTGDNGDTAGDDGDTETGGDGEGE